MKVGYDYVRLKSSDPDFLPYEEARNNGSIRTSDGFIVPVLFPCIFEQQEAKKYTSGRYENLPEFLKRISRYIADFEKREAQEKELLKSLNEALDAQLEPQKPEPPKNFFMKLFVRLKPKKENVAVYPGLGFGDAKLALHLMKLAKLHAKQGHGYAAEMGNNLIDRLMLRNAKIVGDNNALNGADRLVDGVRIQCKYHQDGESCIADCFENGKFRYPGQVIEVPRDKYDEAVEAMRKKIENGEVEGVTDPAEAEKLVRKGWLTYKQAMNLAKPLTLESIAFDAINGTIVGVTAGGISAAFAFAIAKWSGKDNETAKKIAFDNFVFVGGVAGATAFITGQISKSGWSAEVAIRLFGKKGCNKIAHILGSELKGEKAAKLVGSTGVVIVVQAVVENVPDFWDYFFRGRISGGQLAKNVFVNLGKVAGAALGFKVGGGVGAFLGGHTLIGGFIGSLVVGALSSMLVKWLGDLMIDDDSKEIGRIISFEFEILGSDYLWTEDEMKTASQKLSENIDESVIKRIHEEKEKHNRYAAAANVIVPVLEEIASRREKITPPSEEDLMEGLRGILNEDEGIKTQPQESEQEELPEYVVRAALKEMIKANNPEIDERYLVPSARFGEEIPPYKPKSLLPDQTGLMKFADDVRKIFNVAIPEPMEKLSSVLKLAENKTFDEFSKALWEYVCFEKNVININ